MSKIVVDREEFTSFVISFLIDTINHDDEMVISNKSWERIVKKLKLGGLKAPLMQEYLKMDAERRTEYKRIKKVFYEDNPVNYHIQIKGKSDLKEDKSYKYKVKDLLREAVRLVEKEKHKTGFAVTSEKVDRIIEHVTNKQTQWEEE